MGTRSELLGKKKGVVTSNFSGLGLRMQESSCNSANKRMMVVPHNYCNNNHESQLLLSSACSSSSCEKPGGSDYGFDIGGGSVFCDTSNRVACMSDIYDVVGAASGSGSVANNSPAAVLVVSKSLSPSITGSFFHFNSSSGEMAAPSVNVRIPFTAAQLQELERQTLIYNYMVASVPIPHELLFPITKSPSRVSSYQSNSSMELRLLSNSSLDPEPWRCRRTDGKKWRCSRDVAPDQKYCERHSHKSRPRSRKPVELEAHQINNKNNQSVNTLNKSYPKPNFLDQNMASSISSSQQQQQPLPRGLEWFMKGETMPVDSNSNSQEWLQNSSKYGEHHREYLNSNSYTNLGGNDLAFQAQRLHNHNSLFLSPKIVSHEAQTQETRHLIDAFSIGGGEMAYEDGIDSSCLVSSNEKLSSLTLAMSGGSETIERNDYALMGSIGTMGSEREGIGTLRPHWMNHVSGMSSPPGGPLAEALCLGISSSAKSDSNATSPRGCSTSTTTSS